MAGEITLGVIWSAACFLKRVTSENRFNAIATTPVTRLIDVHQASLDLAAENRSTPTRETDDGQSRFVINSLRREIDRLARGFNDQLRVDRVELSFGDEDRPPNELATAPDGARTSSHHPVQLAPLKCCEEIPPLPPESPPIFIAPLLITNIGGLLDLLA